MKLSLCIATYNEEKNIVDCMLSCKEFVDEIIVVDGSSSDKTAYLARQNGAKVIVTKNEHMFHINKQKAIAACTGEWILQLDADERVTRELAEEIKKIISMSDGEIKKYQDSLKEKKLFERHQRLVQSNVIPGKEGLSPNGEIQPKMDNTINYIDSRLRGNDTGSGNDKQEKVSALDFRLSTFSYNAFFIPRLNYFLGGYLRSGGVYPDGVIRLIRKGKAHLPCKSVHELMEVEGKTGWLANPLIHKDSPTFARYLERNSRYIDHLVEELRVRHSRERGQSPRLRGNPEENKSIENHRLDPRLRGDDTQTNINLFFDWIFIKPIATFFSLLIRHKGILDGWRGVVFAFFSAIRFARAYGRYFLDGK